MSSALDVPRVTQVVRRYPLSTLGLAAGTGLVAGLAVHRVLSARQVPASFLERLGLATIVAAAARGLTRSF